MPAYMQEYENKLSEQNSNVASPLDNPETHQLVNDPDSPTLGKKSGFQKEFALRDFDLYPEEFTIIIQFERAKVDRKKRYPFLAERAIYPYTYKKGRPPLGDRPFSMLS